MPVMVGFMEQDGLLYTTRFLKDPEFADAFAGNWSRCGPVSLLGREEEEEKGERALQLTDRLAREYGALRQDGSLRLNGTGMTDLMTDSVFAESSFRLSQHLVRLKRPVYRYSILPHPPTSQKNWITLLHL